MNTHAFLLRSLVALALTLLLVACGGSDSGSGDPGGTDTVTGVDSPSLPGDDIVAGDEDAKPVSDPDTGSTGDDVDPGLLCTPGESYCEDEDTQRVCLEDGDGWLERDCEEGETCLDGDCVVLLCEPGERRCTEDGLAWEACEADGTAWGEATDCEEGSHCVQGICLEQQCEPGDVVCDETSILTCDEDGLGWTREDCPDDELCFAGQCVECVNADQCDDGEYCDAGLCAPSPVTILPPSPPLGAEGQPYSTAFEATGGLEPYTWSAVAGDVPPGLSVAPDGVLEGEPTRVGTFTFTLQVVDANESSDEAEVTVTIEAYVEGVRITSTSPLPNATEGEAYSTQLEVTGGTAPYAWMINSGALPNGLSMDANGGIAGTPTRPSATSSSTSVSSTTPRTPRPGTRRSSRSRSRSLRWRSSATRSTTCSSRRSSCCRC